MNQKAPLLKRLRTIVLWFIALFAVTLGLGIGAVAYLDRTPAKPAPAPTKTEVAEAAPPNMTPPKPAANAPSSAAVMSLTSPVKRGGSADFQVKTVAGATCTASVDYNGAPSRAAGLDTHKADEYGLISWDWTIEPGAPIGAFKAHASCLYNGHTAVVDDNLVITQ